MKIDDNKTYIIITFPEIQQYQDEPDFDENACLINDSKFLDKYGSSAYFVDKEWINNVHQRWHDEDYADSNKREIEDINFLSNL